MNRTTIHPISVGIDTCYLISSEGCTLLIDGGGFGRDNGRSFLRELSRIGVDPLSIDLIVVTHAHWDHIAALDFIQRATRARVAAHVDARLAIETGDPPWPKGITSYGKLMSVFARWFVNPRVKPVGVDILIDEEFDLSPHGIRGKIVHTPGHSAGSLSVILESGEAFVGDMAMQAWYLRWRPGLPILADDRAALLRSWKKILPRAEMIYPAHGKPFPKNIIQKELRRVQND